MMREADHSALEKLFPHGGLIVDVHSNPLAEISIFATINRKAIQEELASIRGDGSTPNWVLDLASTSLFGILSYWGEVYDELDVWCDKSKPLEADRDFLKVMKEDKTMSPFQCLERKGGIASILSIYLS